MLAELANSLSRPESSQWHDRRTTCLNPAHLLARGIRGRCQEADGWCDWCIQIPIFMLSHATDIPSSARTDATHTHTPHAAHQRPRLFERCDSVDGEDFERILLLATYAT